MYSRAHQARVRGTRHTEKRSLKSANRKLAIVPGTLNIFRKLLLLANLARVKHLTSFGDHINRVERPSVMRVVAS